eukprot:Rmarinus@m.26746
MAAFLVFSHLPVPNGRLLRTNVRMTACENGPISQRRLRIGTRGSALALAQAKETCKRLSNLNGRHSVDEQSLEIVKIQTTGDAELGRPLSEIGGKGLFTKEIDAALLRGDIDLAVHSMKDVGTEVPRGIQFVAMLPREDVRDAFISEKADSLGNLPEGAVVGTSSLRRQSQILHLYPHLRCVSFRGNVQTRLKKLRSGEVDATLLACAGLRRLGMLELVDKPLSPSCILPAVAQGAIGICCREDDQHVLDLLTQLDHRETHDCVLVERAFLRALAGSCQTPIAAWARYSDSDQMLFDGFVGSPDGREVAHVTRSGFPDMTSAAVDAAEAILRKVSKECLPNARS